MATVLCRASVFVRVIGTVLTKGWYSHMLCTLIFIHGKNLDRKKIITALY